IRSHFPVINPPTPEENGKIIMSLGLLSLNGLPKKPHTTGALVVGVRPGIAGMCAATRLSFGSAVCVPVKSMPTTAAKNDMAVMAWFNVKTAAPDEILAAPVLVVGTVGGFSCAFVSVASRI